MGASVVVVVVVVLVVVVVEVVLVDVVVAGIVDVVVDVVAGAVGVSEPHADSDMAPRPISVATARACDLIVPSVEAAERWRSAPTSLTCKRFHDTKTHGVYRLANTRLPAGTPSIPTAAH